MKFVKMDSSVMNFILDRNNQLKMSKKQRNQRKVEYRNNWKLLKES